LDSVELLTQPIQMDELDTAPSASRSGAAEGLGLNLGAEDPELDDLKEAAREVLQPKSGRAKRVRLTHSTFFDDERGFKELLRTFPNIKFKGKGEEFRDLGVLLQHYAKWLQELYPSNDHFEDVVFKTRDVLNQKDRLEDNSVSDPREHLHLFRFHYKTEQDRKRKSVGDNDPNTVSTGSKLSDEARKRIEENKQKALERKRQKEAASAAVQQAPAGAAQPPSQTAAAEDAFAMWDDEDPFLGGDMEEDVFGFGFGFDDDDMGAPQPAPPPAAEPAVEAAPPTAPLEAVQEPVAAPAAPAAVASEEARKRIEENRRKALERKRLKEQEKAEQDA